MIYAGTDHAEPIESVLCTNCLQWRSPILVVDGVCNLCAN